MVDANVGETLVGAFPPPPDMFNEHLVSYLPLILLWAAVFTSLLFLSGPLSSLLVPDIYDHFPRKEKIKWDVRVVSTVFSIAVSILALPNLTDPVLLSSPLWAYTESSLSLVCIASGYFLYDTVTCMVWHDIYSFEFLAHGAISFQIFFWGTRPFLNYYASIFLLFEVSTIFLNLNWFLDKAKMTMSPIGIVNGLILLFTFGGVRVVFGLYQSYHFWVTMLSNTDTVHVYFIIYYLVSNLILCSLNIFWYSKMIQMVIAKVTEPKKNSASPSVDASSSPTSKKAANGKSTNGAVHRH